MSSSRDVLRVGIYCEGALIGGAERSLAYLVGALSDAIEVTVLSPSAALLDEVKQYATWVETVATPKARSFAGRVKALRRCLTTSRPDVVHVVLPNPWAARDMLIAAYSVNVPVVVAEHLTLAPRRRRGRQLGRLLGRPIVTTVVVGQECARQMVDWWGTPASSIRVIHNGIPTVMADPVQFPHRPVIGCACRLEHQKGLDVLLHALAELPDVHAVFVGDGQEREPLAALAARLGVGDRVSFVGWVADARPYIAGVDAFVLPSRGEAFPLTILEAMLHSTPVIATDVGSVADVVHDGVTGVLVPPDDSDALRDAVRRLLDDVQLRERIVHRAQVMVRERFTAEQMAAKYVDVWREAAERYPHGRWRVGLAATGRKPR